MPSIRSLIGPTLMNWPPLTYRLGSSGWIRAFLFSLPILRACRRRSSELVPPRLCSMTRSVAAEAGTHGVFLTLEIWPIMIHAWHLWNAHLAAGQRALINAGDFLNLPAGALGRGVLARLRSAADPPFRGL